MSTIETSVGKHGPDRVQAGLEREALRQRIAARLFGGEVVPVCLGRFRILHLLGQGGMGQVYAAEDDRLGRVVALKVIRPGTARDGHGERARLLREARALARLAHPHVVHVYEVGEHGDDVFIAMEHIAGVTLDRWLTGAQRSLVEILEVFVAAGRGLAAAHAAGITHRDFKPGNVIVGDDGRVRILDFGLARGTGEPAPRSSAIGGDGSTLPDGARSSSDQVAGTPAYMSPEHLMGRQVGALSDQFSFCVALYEALFGVRPYQPEDLISSLVRRAPPDFSARRGRPGVPAWLRRMLSRGLDFDPARRFASMHALLAALDAGRRRRRRALMLFAGVIGLGGALYAGALVSQPPVVCAEVGARMLSTWAGEQREAVRQAFHATARDGAGEQAREVVAELDAYAARWLDLQRDTCIASRVVGEASDEQMDRSTLCLERGRRGLAAIAGLLARTDPALQASADEMIDRLPDLERCRDVEALASEKTPAIGRRSEALQGKLDRAEYLQTARLGRPALAAAEEALADARAASDAATEAEALLIVGKVHLHGFRDAARAMATLHEADVRATASGHDGLMWAIWNELAFAEADLHESPEAASRWLDKARSAYAREGGDPDGEAALLATEGHIASVSRHLDHALALRRRELEIHRRRLGPDAPAVVWSRMNVANSVAEHGAADADTLREAQEELRGLLAEARAKFGSGHPIAASVAVSLALMHLDAEEYVTAEWLLRDAHDILIATYGPLSANVASVELGLAVAAGAKGELPAAIEHATTALKIFRAEFHPAYSETFSALGLLGDLYLAEGRNAEALQINRAMLALVDEHGLDTTVVPEILVNIGDYLCLLEQCQAALPYYARLATYLAARPPDDPAELGYPLQGLGRTYLARGSAALAMPHLEEALRIFRAHPQKTRALTAQTARLLAQSLDEQGIEPRRARRLLAEAAKLESLVQ